MKKALASCQCYVLHFDTKYEIETFGSITEIVDYLTFLGLDASKKEMRLKILDSINNYKDFVITKNHKNLGERGYCFFVSKHKMKIECSLHS